ncbi:hypothetical protein [Stenotrophomonas sp.]|uniref:hypothetical protein n=1 Tax=Stenotrophomonas sp. TaxID=69392 RepID=UPI002FC8AE27
MNDGGGRGGLKESAGHCPAFSFLGGSDLDRARRRGSVLRRRRIEGGERSRIYRSDSSVVQPDFMKKYLRSLRVTYIQTIAKSGIISGIRPGIIQTVNVPEKYTATNAAMTKNRLM